MITKDKSRTTREFQGEGSFLEMTNPMSEIILDNLFCLIKRLIYIDTHAHTHAAEEAPKKRIFINLV